MVAVVALLNPAGAGVVVALLFPMFRSIYRVPPGTREGCHYICTIDKAYHNHNVLATRSLTKVPPIMGAVGGVSTGLRFWVERQNSYFN
jgi:hypothetical protein